MVVEDVGGVSSKGFVSLKGAENMERHPQVPIL